MPKEERKKGTHLTWDDRHEIQKGLKEHRTFKEIAFSDLETRLMLRAYENNQTEPARKHLEMFLLNRLCGYNISELAAYYKVSHSVVSTGIFRAKQKLRIYYFLSA